MKDITLPVETHSSCIVPWDANTFMVIGGNPSSSGYTKFSQIGTFLVNLNDNTVTVGPALINARFRHACSEMTVNGEEFIVVTGGNPVKQSTEYLSKASFNDGWKEGTDLPVPLHDHQMVSSPDKQYVYTIGNDATSYNKDIYKYSCNGDITQCGWTKIETQPHYGRERFVAFAIPDSLANKLCE